ncbi:MAG TPA: DUF3185 domain-containing protein [Candidatus Eisenbacteria bacterium]|nr:DUF3185 domain-containing protein [Candidatus Eisenbacteria bacterium]
MKLLGAILIVLGIVGLLYGGFTYTKREKVVDFGPLQATVDQKKTVPIPPILGVVALGAGLILVLKRNPVS